MFEEYPDILNIEEFSEAMRIGKTKCYALLAKNEIKAYREGRDWKIPRNALIDYVIKKSGLPQG